MSHSHHIQMPCCGWAPNAHLGSGKCPSQPKGGFPLPGHRCTYVNPSGASSPVPFLQYRCACGKPCAWCAMAEDLRVRNPFPNAKPEARPKQCEMDPHQCADCFERDALALAAKGDPSVTVFHCNPTRTK